MSVIDTSQQLNYLMNVPDITSKLTILQDNLSECRRTHVNDKDDVCYKIFTTAITGLLQQGQIIRENKNNNNNNVNESIEKKENRLKNEVYYLLEKLNVGQSYSIKDIQTKFKDNAELRSTLESQLQDLYGNRHMKLYDVNENTHFTIYATLAWTLIATTSLYYILRNSN